MAEQHWSVRTIDWIRACIDMGSGRGKVAGQLVPAGQTPEGKKIFSINLFGSANPQVDLMMLYDDDNNLILGRQNVIPWIQDHPSHAGRVLEQFKLALCRDYWTSPAVKRVYEVLGIKLGDIPEIEELFTDLLKICMDHIQRRFQTSGSLRSDVGTGKAGDWSRSVPIEQQLPIELQLTVPVIWDGVACGVMRNAAKKAGFTNTVLRSEPLCAAARFVYDDWEDCESLRRIKAGDVLTFFDLGRGTGDISTIHVQRPASTRDRHNDRPTSPEGKPNLTIVGPSHGGLAGCQVVNDKAWEWIQSQPEYKAQIEELGIPFAAAHQQFTKGFEQCKKDFPTNGFRYRVDIFSSSENQDNGRRREVNIVLAHDDMLQWFTAAAKRAAKVLDDHFDATKQYTRKAIILSGGGAINDFNRAYLGEHVRSKYGLPIWFHSTGHDSPVPEGALLLYLENPPKALDERMTFALVRSEDWEPRLHSDATRWIRSRQQNDRGHRHDRHAVPIEDDVFYAKWDPTTAIVPDRLLPILSIEPGRLHYSRVAPVVFEIPADDRRHARLRFGIYSKTGSIKEHSALRYKIGQPTIDENGLPYQRRGLQPGLTEWPLTYTDLPDLEELGFQARRASNGRLYYSVNGSVQLLRRGDHLDVEVRLYAPSHSFPYAQVDGVETLDEVALAAERPIFGPNSLELWALHRSHKVLNGGRKRRRSSLPLSVPSSSETTPRKSMRLALRTASSGSSATMASNAGIAPGEGWIQRPVHTDDSFGTPDGAHTPISEPNGPVGEKSGEA